MKRYQDVSWYVKIWRWRWYPIAWWRGFRYWVWMMTTTDGRRLMGKGLSPWRVAIGEIQCEKMAYYVTLEEIRKELRVDE